MRHIKKPGKKNNNLSSRDKAIHRTRLQDDTKVGTIRGFKVIMIILGERI